MNLIIDYLQEEKRIGKLYQDAIKLKNNADEYVLVDDVLGFEQAIRGKDLGGYGSIIILTHGAKNIDFISKDDKQKNAIAYDDLIHLLNSVKGQNLKLNLAGVCHSHRIEEYSETSSMKFGYVKARILHWMLH